MRLLRKTRLRRSAVLASGVAVATTAGMAGIGMSTAFAATGAPTTLTLSASATSISYGQQETLSGQLTETSDPSAGVADETVTITEDYGTGTATFTATTNSEGDYSVTTALLAAGRFRASFAGATGDGYDASYSSWVPVNAADPLDLPNPVVTLNPQPSSDVGPTANLTFTGKATITVDGTTEPVADSPVVMWGDEPGAPTPGGSTTAANGTFSITVPATEGPNWNAVVIPPGYGNGENLFNEAYSKMENVYVEYKTRVVDFKAPSKVAADSAKLTGQIQEWNGSKWTAAPDVAAVPEYRSLPSGKWRREDGGGYSNASGDFSIPGAVSSLGHFEWKITVAKQNNGSVYEASTSGTQDTWFVSHTYEDDFQTYTGPTYASLDGFITTEASSGDAINGFPVSGIAKFYYHPRGTTKWTYLGEKKIDSETGQVTWSVDKTSGYFEVVYPAQGNYLGSSKVVKIS
jgi:hypothetical protein